MIKLFILNFILIALIVFALIILRKYIKTDKQKRILLIVAAILTIVCHYSSLIYHGIKDQSAMSYLESNPNLILPIYPCNVVMWCCLILAFCKKESKVFKFLVDYIFLFGIVSALVGLFANVDFIRNPSLADYDITKGILAHAFMMFNVLLLPILGYFKLDLVKNMIHIGISIIMMFVIGCYCNIVIKVLSGADYAYNVNSMFILHSPFEGVEFLKYPFISLIAIVGYFIIFNICEMVVYKNGDRWFNRIKSNRI